MEAVRQYIIGVAAAAMLCAVVRSLVGGQGACGALTMLVTGILMTFAVVQPLAHIQIPDMMTLWKENNQNGVSAAYEGEKLARDAMADIISEQTCTYILDKGTQLGLTLKVQVIVSDDELPVPVEVVLSGSASPGNRNVLQTWIQDTLGISKENQLWTD